MFQLEKVMRKMKEIEQFETIRLVLPYPPTTGNGTTRKGRYGFYTVAPIKHFRAVVEKYLIENKLVLELDGPLRVQWFVSAPTKRAVDADNILKVCQDALSRAGFWSDDSNKVIKRTEFTWLDPVACGHVNVSIDRYDANIVI